MTKKEFFTKKIIPKIEEQIFDYEFQLIRNQYILGRLESELKILERTPILQPGEDIEKALKEIGKRKADLKQEIERIKSNIAYLPLMIEEEKKFLEYFKQLADGI